MLYGNASKRVQNEQDYFRPGVACTTSGAQFGSRASRHVGIFADVARSVFDCDIANVTCLLNSAHTQFVASSLNPTVNFTVGDINRLPILAIVGALKIFNRISESFEGHEVRRECAIEFTSPGPSPWRYAQDWAQRAVDRPEGERLPPYEEQRDPEPPTATDISFALGIALGRFGPTWGNIHRFDANTL